MLIASIAFDTERNLGRAYNRMMQRLEADDWCVFLDHDAIWTTRFWYSQLLAAIAANPDGGLFTACTNRIGRKEQIAPGCPQGHDMREHFAFGDRLYHQCGSSVRDMTGGNPISGVVMCLSKSTWEKMGGFSEGFFGVDNNAHWAMKRIGKKVYLLPGLYVYHWYRADGRGHRGAPRARKRVR